MSKTHRAYLGLLFSVATWGSMYVAGKFVLDVLPTFTVLAVRFGLASLLMLLLARRKRLPPIQRGDLRMILFIGVVGYFLSNACLMLGIKYSSASVSSLINATNPIFIIICARIFLKEPITLQKSLCVICSIVGAMVVIGASGGAATPLGVLFTVTSIILWAFVTIALRSLSERYDPLVITGTGMLISAVCSLPVAVGEFLTAAEPIPLDWPVILGALYIAIFPTMLGHLTWNRCLGQVEVGSCAAFYPIQPMVSVLLGWLLLDESINLQFLFGALLIIAGVVVGMVRPRRRKAVATNAG